VSAVLQTPWSAQHNTADALPHLNRKRYSKAVSPHQSGGQQALARSAQVACHKNRPAGRSYSVRTAPTGEFIPLVVLEASDRQGVYMGLEWSYCRIEAATLASGASSTVRVRAGNLADLRVDLAPGETCEIRPGFLGACRGDWTTRATA
jgi:hypothetical protein